jgi:ADP-ribose pyrophosphatase
MHDDELLETTVERRTVHTGRYLAFRVDTIADAHGRHHTREWVEHPGAVAILAVADGAVLLVRQYRTPAARVLLEIPAGTLDRGPDGAVEDPDVAAPRELGEETGCHAAHWRVLSRFFPAPGFAGEVMHLYLATGLTPIDGYAGPEPDERLALVRVPIGEAIALAAEGGIEDGKTLLALFWLERLIAGGQLTP